MSIDHSIGTVMYPIECDIEALKTSLSHLSLAEKHVAIYLLLHSILGERPQQEGGVYDPEGFIYLSLIPPGKHEYFRRLEDPGLSERLAKAAREPAFPLEQIRKELGMDE